MHDIIAWHQLRSCNMNGWYSSNFWWKQHRRCDAQIPQFSSVMLDFTPLKVNGREHFQHFQRCVTVRWCHTVAENERSIYQTANQLWCFLAAVHFNILNPLLEVLRTFTVNIEDVALTTYWYVEKLWQQKLCEPLALPISKPSGIWPIRKTLDPNPLGFQKSVTLNICHSDILLKDFGGFVGAKLR